jgi:hypothetical protein
MAHCPPELLDDLRGVFDELRDWPGMVEKSRGAFYLRRTPFLHFHLFEGGRRRGDIKTGADWIEIDLPRPLSQTRVRAFLRELRRRYDAR